jgi:hypothetical protein
MSDLLEQIRLKEFKKMTVTFNSMADMSKASHELARQGFTIDAKGMVMKVNGKGADLNKFAIDLKNAYGAKVIAEDNDHEISMARGELEAIADKALKLSTMLKTKSDADQLEAWVQSKITKAKDYVNSVADYMEYNPDMNEKFTMKDYKKNENDNEHSLNALELVKAFGTPADKKEMQGIYDRHMKRGHIGQVDYAKRNQIHNKYISKLKEEIDMLPENFSDAQVGVLKKAYAPLKGKRISVDQAHKLMGILDKFDSNKNALEKLAKAGIPFVSDLAVSRLISKHKYRADQLKNLKEEDSETERLKQELEKKDDQINLLKQKAVNDKAKSTQAATQKMVNPETGEPLLQVGIAYKHLRDKMAKEKAAEANREKETKIKFNNAKRNALKTFSKEENQLDESDMMDKARSMGLTYMSFGRWGKDGKVTHKNISGNLTAVDSKGDPKEPVDTKSKDEPKSSEKPKQAKTAYGFDKQEIEDDIADMVTDHMINVEIDDDGSIGMVKEYEPSQDYDAEQDMKNIISYLKDKNVDPSDVQFGIDGSEEEGYLQLDVLIMPKGQGKATGQDATAEQVEQMVEYTTQQIKMAYGVANDKRYKGGNYSGAVKAIEKIAKGLSNHPDVMKVLKRTNENIEEMAKDDAYAIGMSAAKKKYNDEPPLDKKTIKKGHEIADKIMKKEYKTLRAEGKMSDIDALQKQGKGAEEIAKLMKLPVKTVKQILGEYSGYVDIRGRLSNTQLDNIKKTWAKKSYKDVTKGLRDMMKDMDPGSKAAIRAKNINVLSKLVDENKNHPAKEVYESITAVKNKAEKTGMPYSILKKVYDRGMAAWRGGHRPGATQVQWALARVNSFVTKSSGTWGGADKDLAKQVRGK